jgi:hypothetical protein
MQRRLKRLFVALLLGSALAFGTLGGGLLGQPTSALACPGNGTGGGC